MCSKRLIKEVIKFQSTHLICNNESQNLEEIKGEPKNKKEEKHVFSFSPLVDG